MHDLEDFINLWIVNKFGQAINGSTNFFDIGLFDSLTFAELIIDIENFLDVEIDFTSILDWKDVSSINGLKTFLRSND
jgi:acyl carrier protein